MSKKLAIEKCYNQVRRQSTKHPLQCCSVTQVLCVCLTEKHMGTHRCTPEERDLSEGFSAKCPGCSLILGQNESKAEEENFTWERGAWVGHTSTTQGVCTWKPKTTEMTRAGHFDLKRQLISQVKKPNNAGKLI